MDNIGIIGTGNMGGAILKGWSSLAGVHLLAYDVDEKKTSQRLRRVKS